MSRLAGLSSLRPAARASLAVPLAIWFFAGDPVLADARFRSSIEALEVGHWIEVRGELGADGVFAGEDVELLPAQNSVVLIGTVSSSERDARRFRLLGRDLATGGSTRWSGLDSSSIAGVRVKVKARFGPDGSLVARQVTNRGPGRDRVGGRIDELRREVDGLHAKILGFDVRLPGSFQHEEALEAYVLQASSSSLYLSSTRDEDDLFGKGVAIGANSRFTGQIEVLGEGYRDLDLDSGEEDDFELAALRARVRLDYSSPGGRVSAAIEGRGQEEWTFAAAGDDSNGRARLGEAYLAFEKLAHGALEIVVGRQDFDDPREWIYDENLDAIRLLAAGERFRFEIAAGTVLDDGSARDEATDTFVAVLSNADRRRRLSAWAMHRRVDLAVPERASHFGLRAGGRWTRSTDSWIDLALFRGERGSVDLEGWAVDAGVTWRAKWLGPFAVTAGYALGSGGSISPTKDETFRQTGMQDNNDKFAGVTSFRYYGELFDPELANLRVLTAGLGVRFGRKSSLDLVWHAYEQDTARRRLISTNLDRRADGVHTDLGWEADLILGSRERPWFDLEIVAAYFEPGEAFPDDADPALYGKLQMRVRF